MGASKAGEGRYLYKGWMLCRHDGRLRYNQWVLCTPWEYRVNEDGVGMTWVFSKPCSDHKIERMVKVLDARHPGSYIHCSATLRSLKAAVDKLEEGEYYPKFSDADMKYLKTREREEIPRMLAKWPACEHLQELLTGG